MFRPRERGNNHDDRNHENIGMKNTLFGGKLPTIDTKQCRELDKRMSKYLIRLANQTANHVIQDTLDEHISDIRWERINSLRGVHIYRAFDMILPSLGTCTTPNRESHNSRGDSIDGPVYLHGVTEVNASLEEFAMLFKMDSHKDTREHSMLFNPDLLKMKSLYTLVLPSGEHPRRSVNIKWCVIQSPLSWMFHHRDFCYLECQKEFHDPKGRKGWIRSMHSIKMPSCANFEKTYGIVRASLYRCGILAIESDRLGILEVHQTIEIDLKGNIPQTMQIKMFSNRLAAMSTIDRVLQRQRLSSFPLLGDLDIPSSKMKASCHFCYRPFSTFYRRMMCRKCGEGVCKNCSDTWTLDIPCIGRKKVCICTVCSAKARYAHVIPPSQQQRNRQQRPQCPKRQPTNEIPASFMVYPQYDVDYNRIVEPLKSAPAISTNQRRRRSSRRHQEIETSDLVLPPTCDPLVAQQYKAIQSVHLGSMRRSRKEANSMQLTQDHLLQSFDSQSRLNLPAAMQGAHFTSTRNDILERRRLVLLNKNKDNNAILSQKYQHPLNQAPRRSYSAEPTYEPTTVNHKNRRRNPRPATLFEEEQVDSAGSNDPIRRASFRLYDEDFSNRGARLQEQELERESSGVRMRSLSEVPEMVHLSGEQKKQSLPSSHPTNQSTQEACEYVENDDGEWQKTKYELKERQRSPTKSSGSPIPAMESGDKTSSEQGGGESDIDSSDTECKSLETGYCLTCSERQYSIQTNQDCQCSTNQIVGDLPLSSFVGRGRGKERGRTRTESTQSTSSNVSSRKSMGMGEAVSYDSTSSEDDDQHGILEERVNVRVPVKKLFSRGYLYGNSSRKRGTSSASLGSSNTIQVSLEVEQVLPLLMERLSQRMGSSQIGAASELTQA